MTIHYCGELMPKKLDADRFGRVFAYTETGGWRVCHWKAVGQTKERWWWATPPGNWEGKA